MFATRNKVPRVITVQDGIVKTRFVRKNAAGWKYDPNLQEILDLEGRPALERTARRWFHGFLRKAPRAPQAPL